MGEIRNPKFETRNKLEWVARPASAGSRSDKMFAPCACNCSAAPMAQHSVPAAPGEKSEYQTNLYPHQKYRMYSALDKSVAAKLLWAWDDGCPIAPYEAADAAKMAAIARRRWNSYERRNKNIPDTTENRINDLARGLATKYTEGGWPMVGPLISDYRWLSEQIAPILAGNE